MDDDRSTKSIGAQALRRSGCHVFEAESDIWAMHVINKFGAIIDAAILDVQDAARQPVGVEVARKIKALFPKIKILLVSGADRPTNDFHFLPKPYEIEDILNILKSMDA